MTKAGQGFCRLHPPRCHVVPMPKNMYGVGTTRCPDYLDCDYYDECLELVAAPGWKGWAVQVRGLLHWVNPRDYVTVKDLHDYWDGLRSMRDEKS